MRPTIGVDPGGAETGLVWVNAHGAYVDHRVLDTASSRRWQDIAAELEELVEDPGYVVAVEDVRKPTPHLGIIAVGGLLRAATVLGIVVGIRLDAIVVPPAGLGSGPLAAYPDALRGPRERTGSGRLRHCRSAWDVALAAQRVLQVHDRARQP